MHSFFQYNFLWRPDRYNTSEQSMCTVYFLMIWKMSACMCATQSEFHFWSCIAIIGMWSSYKVYLVKERRYWKEIKQYLHDGVVRSGIFSKNWGKIIMTWFSTLWSSNTIGSIEHLHFCFFFFNETIVCKMKILIFIHGK